MNRSGSLRPIMVKTGKNPPGKSHISVTVRDRAISSEIWAPNLTTARISKSRFRYSFRIHPQNNYVPRFPSGYILKLFVSFSCYYYFSFSCTPFLCRPHSRNYWTYHHETFTRHVSHYGPFLIRKKWHFLPSLRGNGHICQNFRPSVTPRILHGFELRFFSWNCLIKCNIYS